jgi:hypothetical protein
MTITRTALVALAAAVGTVTLAGPASAGPRFTPAWPAKWYPTTAAHTDAGAEGQDILIWVPPPS